MFTSKTCILRSPSTNKRRTTSLKTKNRDSMKPMNACSGSDKTKKERSKKLSKDSDTSSKMATAGR